jgi:hypothetical protein
VQAQLAVLNQDLAKYNLSFQLAGIDRTINTPWADGVGDGTAEEVQMKTALRKGGPADLNVYIVPTIAGAPPGYMLDQVRNPVRRSYII